MVNEDLVGFRNLRGRWREIIKQPFSPL